MDELNLATYPCVTTSGAVEEICKPLNLLKISYFTLDRIFKDGTRLILTNRADWIQHYYSRSYYKKKLFDTTTIIGPVVLWKSLSRYPVYSDASEYFDIDHGVTLIEKKNEFIDFFNFGSNKNNPGIQEYFLSNIDLLKRFTYYFLEQGDGLLKIAEKQKINLHKNADFIISDSVNPVLNDKGREKFLEMTKLNRLYVNNGKSTLFFTKKESECLSHIAKGKTMKETARLMSVSPRTVEGHLVNLKDKFSCYSKSQVAEIYLQSVNKIGGLIA